MATREDPRKGGLGGRMGEGTKGRRPGNRSGADNEARFAYTTVPPYTIR